ncbi:MAG: SDR family oxidoreductase [Oscillospiraceae bacterium]|nr:SDR family oxidoreductase [Oscillospiraceae bacterium]
MLKIDLTGKTVIITGATGQLGRVMAQKAAQCGANVIIHYSKNESAARMLEEEITSYNVRAFSVQADVTKQESVDAMREKIEKEFVMPDIIICAAVIQYEWVDVLSQPIEDYYSQFESCVMHNVYMAKAFVPHLKAQKYGRFISINTECAYLAEANCSAYTAGKRGMDGLLRCLAKEIAADNITVNEIAPGWTISYIDRENGTQKQESYDRIVPMGRRGTDEEVANMAMFLASDLASFTTGCYIPVCGGRVMPAI